MAAARGRAAAKKKKGQRVQRPTPQAQAFEFPCVLLSQGNRRLVLFAAKAKHLFSFVDINRREENKDKGYQRALSQRRVSDIAEYIDAGKALPTGLLVSLDEAEVDEAGRRIRIPNRPNAGWVIDGQHRLAGAYEAGADIELPVVGFIGLGLSEQIQQFVTINREQKGVPTSLHYELLPHLPGVRSEKEVLQLSAKELAKALTTDETSPFFGKIVSTTTPKRGQLSLTNVIRKLSPHVKLNSVLAAQFNHDERRQILNNYPPASG